MIDGYIYAEIKRILQIADADAFDGYALTGDISDRDLNKYAQALYPLLVNYFDSTKVNSGKDLNDKAYVELSSKYSSLIEEALFYKSIIKKLLEVSK
jgi:hypothetical protein